MEVVLAITAQAAIDETLRRTELPSEHGVAEPLKCGHYRITGFRSALRGLVGQSTPCATTGKLKRLAGSVGGGLDFAHGRPDGHGICHLTPCRSFGCDVSTSAVEAAEAAQHRQELELGRTRLGAIQEAIVERPNYQYWLNHIAASAPDTVYFDRLNFDGSEVVVSGYSNNASVYLRMLTEEPGYTDVAALSAFARDRNNGLSDSVFSGV